MAKIKPKYLKKITVPPETEEGHIFWPSSGLDTIPEIAIEKTYTKLYDSFTKQVQKELSSLMQKEEFVFRLKEIIYSYQCKEEMQTELPNKKEILAAMTELHQNAAELHNNFLRADPVTFQFFMEAADTLEKEYCIKNNIPEPVIKKDCIMFSEKLLNDLRLFGITINKAKEIFGSSKYERKNYARYALAYDLRRILRNNNANCKLYKDGLWAACMQIVLSYCSETLSSEAILTILHDATKKGPGVHGDIIVQE